ncbi:MAG TPA: APC family permease [Acidimicrobiia bacterium]|nr:APC family permease [Acidimicrobiia bacterium]
MSAPPGPRLSRQLGLGAAVLLGLGSIIGTGVFVSIGIAAGITGGSVVVAVVIAALLATCNGLSSAQLAAAYPVSGGTYEYGYQLLTPSLGFTAGWLFLLAKSASAATAALGFAGYALNFFDIPAPPIIPVALAAVVLITGVVLTGIRLSNLVNAVVVTITLAGLTAFVVGGSVEMSLDRFRPFVAGDHAVAGLLEAAALMFVAYTGYGRIATLGEEVRSPRSTIPRAIIVTLIVSMVLYGLVALAGVGNAGAPGLAGATDATAAPLEVIARRFRFSWVAPLVAVAAVTAMLGVLLNLLLGLSRVLLAMGRRADMPRPVTRLTATNTTPYLAVLAVGAVIAGLVLIGDVKTTWSFSAFTVLIYYAITNLAALRLPGDMRLYPRWVTWLGLAGCLGLAFWVEPVVWAAGLGLIAAGLGWHALARKVAH